MFKARTILRELKKYKPDLIKFSRDSLEGSNYDLDFRRLNKKAFKKCPDISIDKAVMEKTNIGT